MREKKAKLRWKMFRRGFRSAAEKYKRIKMINSEAEVNFKVIFFIFF